MCKRILLSVLLVLFTGTTSFCADGDPLLAGKVGDGSELTGVDADLFQGWAYIPVVSGGTGKTNWNYSNYPIMYLPNSTSAAEIAIGTAGQYLKVKSTATGYEWGTLGSAATRSAEDTLTNGSNLPDGAAIKAYGDSNWGSGAVPWVRPEDYGAVVNDSTDDTAAFVLALAAGDWVLCSEGTYNFSSHFTIPSGKYLSGVKPGDYFIDETPTDGTIFVPSEITADNDTTYFIEMESNSRISDLCIFYSGQYTTNRTPKIYPWTLWTDGDVRGVHVSDISVYRAYKFMFAHGSSFVVTNVYGNIIKYGIWDTKGGDTSYYTNVHFQPVHSPGNQWVVTDMWAWSTSNGTRAFYTGVGTGAGGTGNSWNKFTNCFGYGFEYVFYVDTGVSGTVLTNCGGDYSKHPFYILGTKTILNSCQAVAGDRLDTSTRAVAYHGFTIGNSTYETYNLNMTNCHAWSCAGAGVYIEQAENTSIDNMMVTGWSQSSDGGQWGAIHFPTAVSSTEVFATSIRGLNTDAPGSNGASSIYCQGTPNYLTVVGGIFRGDGKTGTYGLRGAASTDSYNYANLFIGCATDVSGTWTSAP